MSEATKGDRFELLLKHEDGSPFTLELVLGELDGEPWLFWDYAPWLYVGDAQDIDMVLNRAGFDGKLVKLES